MKILITGRPGIGKTTIIRKLAHMLGNQAGGFVTAEVRSGGKRTGFMLECLSGKRAMLAEVSAKGSHRVGKYRVLIQNLESIGIEAIDEALSQKKILLIDEIGKMEILSNRFRQLILEVLRSDINMVATIGISDDPFLDGIRSAPDVNIFEVTFENRDRLVMDILKMIKEGQSR